MKQQLVVASTRTHLFHTYVEIYDWAKEGKGRGYDSISLDTDSLSAVMVKDGDQFISYDNSESFKWKVDYATEKCFGGTMVWAIDMLPANLQGSAASASDGSSTQSIFGEDEDAANDAFCGASWDKAISSCSTPCPAGTSDDCPQGETCFAGTPCNGGGGGVAVADSCKICPDTSRQGIRGWVEIEVEINGTFTETTCGELDYGVLLSIPRKSEICDATKLEHSQKCCYNYPEEPCWLCRKDMLYYTVRSELNVTTPNGLDTSCGDVDKMLAPEEDRGDVCTTTRDALFDKCCYRQCSLCGGDGLKWWVEFDEERRLQDSAGDEDVNATDVNVTQVDTEVVNETITCSSVDASLYMDFVEDDTDECTAIKAEYTSECCFPFPKTPCGLCKGLNDTQSMTLLWAEEVEYNGASVTCGVVDNIVNSEEANSLLCSSAQEKYREDCCFDKCSLCDTNPAEGEQLAWDFVVDFNETSKTCGEIEAIFTAEQVNSKSEECRDVKSDYHDLCCFRPPTSPCELCSEFVRWDEIVEFDGANATCKDVVALLKREEEIGEKCLMSTNLLEASCCYELCNVCGDSLLLDWDAVVEYDEAQVSCGDLKPIFGKNEIEHDTEECATITSNYQDLCCYYPPISPCNLCRTDSDFLEAYSSVEIELWGSSTNCSDAYDYLIKRIESESDTCSSAKESIFNECCYKKCAICGEGFFQDFNEKIDFGGDTISCLQLHTVRTLDVSAESEECSIMQSQYSETCCYDAPEVPCILCVEGAVQITVEVDFRGQTQSCESVANYLGSRSNNGTEECTSSISEFRDFCCFDKCTICMNETDMVDWETYVDFDSSSQSCGNFDWYFTSNVVKKGSQECTDLQMAYSEKCCYAPIDYTVPACSLCKQGEVWYDLNGDIQVEFEGEPRSCNEVSNSLFRKSEDSSEICAQARSEYFDSCCFVKCDLCQDAQLDANVEIMYNNAVTTCLELGLKFSIDIIQEGSDECNTARELFAEPCCFLTPTEPCTLCSNDGNQGQVRANVDVNFYGSQTTCSELNSFLVSREEQVGFMCQAAKTELQGTCCFEMCTICGNDGNLYWDNPVQFNDMKFACGELTWILSGEMIEDGTPECIDMQTSYFDQCCTGPSLEIPEGGDKCEICPSGKDWYAQVTYNETPMTCLELDSVLLRDGLFDGSDECQSATEQYSAQCCYTPPIKSCNLCQSGERFFSIKDQRVTFNGAETNCYGIHNYLYTRVEADDNMCIGTQIDLFDICCYDRCRLCHDYQLDMEAVVVHHGTSMGCSEIENSVFALNQTAQGSKECLETHKEHFDECCYDIPCSLCTVGDKRHELLVSDPVTFQGRTRTCGEVSVLMEAEMSQSGTCKNTKHEVFDTCCFQQCELCTDPGWVVNWNRPLSYDGLASTCIDVYMNLRNEMVAAGDDRCLTVQHTLSEECCYKIPSSQCSLCQNSNGTFLNTNWNYEVTYQGASVTCSDVSAMLSSEELDSLLCLSTRDQLWNDCCVPHEGGDSGLGGISPSLPPEVFNENKGVSASGWSPSDQDEHGLTTFFRRNAANRLLPRSHVMSLKALGLYFSFAYYFC